ncbi:MAG: hypothetical protein ACPGR2_13685 [Psychrobium sp.]
MSLQKINKFNFTQKCKVINSVNGEKYCKKHSINFNEFHNAFRSESVSYIDNNNYHIVYNSNYHYSDLNSFIDYNLNTINYLDEVIINSTLNNISYFQAIEEHFSDKEQFEIYELFADFFDSYYNSDKGKELILEALTEQYLLDDNKVQETFSDFISNVLTTDYLQNNIEKTKEFFIENFDITTFETSEDLTDILLSCFKSSNEFESTIIQNSNEYDFEILSPELQQLQNDLVNGTPFQHLEISVEKAIKTTRNMKKGF